MSGSGKTVKAVKLTGNTVIDGVIDGEAWTGTITYAFPTSRASYLYNGEPDNGVRGVSAAQRNEALFAMEVDYGNKANDGFSVEGFTNATFKAGSASTATIRFAETGNATFDRAYADFPGTDPQDGDIWFGPKLRGTINDYRTPVAGNYAWQTLMHELGHALGLKHGHDGFTGVALPKQYDSPEYSIMTYRGFVGQKDPGYLYEYFGAPQTYMMSDIAALQHMYGADYTTNSGATVYKWKPGSGNTYVNGAVAIAPGGNRIFATVWDGGGTDTYDLSAYKTALKLDLRPGHASTFSADQLSNLGGGPNNGFASGNIYNALLHENDKRSLIENAIGGSGNDVITGNQVHNVLTGNGGQDAFVFSTKITDANYDTIKDFSHADDTFRINDSVFTGLTVGKLSSSAFKNISTGTVDSTDRILYDKANGDLYFDRDGSGTQYDPIKFAHVKNNTVIDHTDFLVI